MGRRESALAASTPQMVDTAVAINVVGKMAAGSLDSCRARRPMMPVGKSASPEVLMARKRIIAFVAVPFSLFSSLSSFMALRPKGVAALPRPRALAAMFITMAPMAGWSAGTSGKTRTRSGRMSRAMNFSPPASSTTFISPRKRAM
jgi:hypothetical protein